MKLKEAKDMNIRTYLWHLGVLCMLLASTQACRGAMWERYNDTGTEAREQGLYAEAEPADWEARAKAIRVRQARQSQAE